MQRKALLLQHCHQYVAQRHGTIALAMQDIQQSLDEETKSSAGDKHETGRAMMQLEQEKLSRQLAEVQQLQHVLERISLDEPSPNIGEGSLVKTVQGNYFIAISAGKVELDGELYFLVSMASPIGAALTGRKAGETFPFRGENILIEHVA